MGGGSWSDNVYASTRSVRASKGVKDFAYTEKAAQTKQIHPNLNPERISGKPFKKLESRDSDEHPNSLPIIISLDVTGSNRTRAVDAQAALPKLMSIIFETISDPQIAIVANDDWYVVPEAALQISDFESDIRIDEHLRSLWLVGCGGGNDGESYDLVLYAAAYKTILDSVEKRNKKGYLFLYADEPFFTSVSKESAKQVFGDDLTTSLPIETVIADARKLYNVFIIFPDGGYDHARKQFVKLFGADYVLDLEHPKMICEFIGTKINQWEKRTEKETAVITKVLENNMEERSW